MIQHSGTPTSNGGQGAPRRSLSVRKRWLFRGGAILAALLLIVALEGVLRLADVGHNVDLVICVADPPAALRYQFNDWVDAVAYPDLNVTGPETRRFDLPKPEGTYRVVVLGASTVIGFPYVPELSFPRQMEVLLNRQEPATRFEVLNAGVTSMNSFLVAELAEECLACDPDLIVVHTGHNEFYGPGGPASTAAAVPPAFVELSFAARRLRLAQLLSQAIPSRHPADMNLIDRLPRTLQIPLEGDIFRQAEANLRRNLLRCIATAQAGRVPILFAPVACNLRDQSPMQAIWPPEVSTQRQAEWEAHLAAAEALHRRNEPDAALQELEDAAAICPNHARLWYRRAQCLETLERFAEARQAYGEARDLDACRFRAPSSFERITREVVDAAGAGVYRVDTVAAVDRAAAPAGPGYELYLEHVHYNLDGHRVLARAIAEVIQVHIRGRTWDEARVPDPQELRNLIGATPEDDLSAISFSLMTLDTAPLRGALDADDTRATITRQLEVQFAEIPVDRRKAFADVAMNRMALDLMGGLTEACVARANGERAREFARLLALRRPWSPEALRLAAAVERRWGDVTVASEWSERADQLSPRD